MPNYEKIDAVVEAYREYGSQRKAAKALGMSRRNFRRYLDQANSVKYNIDPGFKTTKVSKTMDADGRTTSTSIVSKLAPTEDHQERDGKIVRRSTLYGADGSVVGEWIIRKPEAEQQADYVQALDDHFVKDIVRLPTPVLQFNATGFSDICLFMSIDEHLNVKLTADMCGENYGLDDAVAILFQKFKETVIRTPITKKCLFVNLGDQFHSNDHMNVTPQSKHTLDSDRSFYELSKAAITLNRAKIDFLLQHFDEVEVHGVAGNHDIDAQGWLFRCLDIAYEKVDRVSVDFHSDETFAYRFGKTFLGFHHGHRGKPEALAGACADRYPDLYGNTKMRYLHTGHIHHDSVKDLWGGFKWHSHRTLAPKDWYAYSNLYLTRQSTKSFVYNENEGEVACFTSSIV